MDVSHSWNVFTTKKITDLYILCKWENLQNWQSIKYLFSSLYIHTYVAQPGMNFFQIEKLTCSLFIHLLNLNLSCPSICLLFVVLLSVFFVSDCFEDTNRLKQRAMRSSELEDRWWWWCCTRVHTHLSVCQ